jgi:hypothetical protein
VCRSRGSLSDDVDETGEFPAGRQVSKLGWSGMDGMNVLVYPWCLGFRCCVGVVVCRVDVGFSEWVGESAGGGVDGITSIVPSSSYLVWLLTYHIMPVVDFRS